MLRPFEASLGSHPALWGFIGISSGPLRKKFENPWYSPLEFRKYCKPLVPCTEEPWYNEDIGTMKLTLLYQGKKQRNIKSKEQWNYFERVLFYLSSLSTNSVQELGVHHTGGLPRAWQKMMQWPRRTPVPELKQDIHVVLNTLIFCHALGSPPCMTDERIYRSWNLVGL